MISWRHLGMLLRVSWRREWNFCLTQSVLISSNQPVSIGLRQSPPRRVILSCHGNLTAFLTSSTCPRHHLMTSRRYSTIPPIIPDLPWGWAGWPPREVGLGALRCSGIWPYYNFLNILGVVVVSKFKSTTHFKGFGLKSLDNPYFRRKFLSLRWLLRSFWHWPNTF